MLGWLHYFFYCIVEEMCNHCVALSELIFPFRPVPFIVYNGEALHITRHAPLDGTDKRDWSDLDSHLSYVRIWTVSVKGFNRRFDSTYPANTVTQRRFECRRWAMTVRRRHKNSTTSGADNHRRWSFFPPPLVFFPTAIGRSVPSSRTLGGRPYRGQPCSRGY